MKTLISKALCLSLLLGAVSTLSRAEVSIFRQLAADSLSQPQGTTYCYTVDTPENEGLIFTGVRGLASNLETGPFGSYRKDCRKAIAGLLCRTTQPDDYGQNPYSGGYRCNVG